MEVVLYLYDWPERNTRTQVAFKLIYDCKGKTSKFILLDSIVGEIFHRFSFAILSDTSDNLGLE